MPICDDAPTALAKGQEGSVDDAAKVNGFPILQRHQILSCL
jgi:hypothetical protein